MLIEKLSKLANECRQQGMREYEECIEKKDESSILLGNCEELQKHMLALE